MTNTTQLTASERDKVTTILKTIVEVPVEKQERLLGFMEGLIAGGNNDDK